MTDSFDEFVAAAPWPQRVGVKAMLALGRRPRGRRLLSAIPPADQAAAGLLAMDRYEHLARARALGWDPESVAARGRALRREEGRP